jgi:general secretion pathway protein D
MMKAKVLDRVVLKMAGCALAAALALAIPAAVPAQSQGAITPNYKDADLGQIIEAVSAVTGKNFIVDPRVRAQVTMLSSTPMSPAAFYEAFLSILQVHGFVAVPSGDVIKILPDANARQVPALDLPSSVSSTSDEIVTQVFAVRNVSAAQLVPILRPLIPQYGHLAAYPASNMLIISDRAANVNRIARIIQRIDQQGDESIDVIPMEHASAVEVVRIVNNLYAGAAAEGAGAPGVKIVADERTNSILVSGESSQRLRLKTLITHLDTPLESGGDTQVRYLRYADAEKISQKLREQIQGIVATAAPSAAGGAASPAVSGGGGDKSITIWAEPETNALVVTAPPKVMRSVMSIVDRLDIRRAQVLVEAILVEMSVDKAMDLGINWLIADTDSDGNTLPAGGFVQPVDGTGIGQIIQGILNPDAITSLPSGLTMGLGQIVNGADSRPRRHRQHQPHRHAFHRDARQRGGGDQDRAGSAVRHGAVHQPGHPGCRRTGQPVPDHPARGGRQHPQDHATDQRGRFGRAQDLPGGVEHRRELPAGQHERPDHQQADDHHQGAGRGRRHHRARRTDLRRSPREQVPGPLPRLDPGAR